MSAWERAAERLRPLPFRGDLIAAGAVALAVGVALLDVRMRGAWASGVRVAVVGAVAALLLALGWLAPREGPAPRAYVSTILLAAFPLTALGLLDLADALGGGTGAAGTLAWVSAAVGALYLGLGARRGSAACTLLGALALAWAAMSAWRWAFEPAAVTPYEWIALAAIVLAGLGAVVLRDRRRAHAVALANVAGVAALALAYLVQTGPVLGARGVVAADGGTRIAHEAWTAAVPVGGGPAEASAPWGWTLVVAAVGFGLVAYGAVDRERGPAWLGAAVLAAFVVLAAGGGSILWWPLLLAAAGGAAVAAGLRPTDPAPPPPDADATPAPARPLRGTGP